MFFKDTMTIPGKTAQALALVAVLLCLFGAPARAAVTITSKCADIFYFDAASKSILRGIYVAYEITSNADIEDAWADITNFSGPCIALSDNEDGNTHLGALSAGVPKMAFFFLKTTATGDDLTDETHKVNAYDTAPPATPLASRVFTMSAHDETISANANKVDSVAAVPSNPELGGTITITVTGHTGIIGSGNVMSFTPASYADWPADSLELQTTTINLLGPENTGTFTDTLIISPSYTTDTDYQAVYTFRATGTTASETGVSPVGYISSGNQTKHTSTSNFATLTPIQAVSNTLKLISISAATAPSTVCGGTVSFTVTIENTGSFEAHLDDIRVTLPTSPVSPAYVAASTRWGAIAIQDPVQTSQTLSWYNTFTVAAGGTKELTFDISIPQAGGDYAISAIGHIGSEQIDATTNTSDNAPVTFSFSVLNAPTFSAFSFTPDVIPKNGTATLIITLSNTNPSTDFTATAFTNNLPANVVVADSPNAANSCGGTLTAVAGSASISLSEGSIPANGTCTVTVDVTSSVEGVYNNFIPAGGLTTALGSCENTASPEATLTVTVDPIITKTFTPDLIAINGTSKLILTIVNPDDSTDLTNVAVTDTLPANVVVADLPNAFNTCSGTLTATAGATSISLSGGNIPAGVSRTIEVDVTSAVAGLYTNTISAGDLTADGGKSNLIAATDDLTVIAGKNVSGYVYNDANHSTTRESGELKPGATVYVKLCADGSVVQVQEPGADGYYTFTGVAAGDYTIVEDSDNDEDNCTPNEISGWVSTTPNIRTFTMASTDIYDRNFGDYNGSNLSGFVFKDKGNGSADSVDANNAKFDGSEGGIGNVTVRACMDAGCLSVKDSSQTDSQGFYTLWIPASVANGTLIYIVENDSTLYTSTGTSINTTVQKNTLNTLAERNRHTYSMMSGESPSDYNFGDVGVMFVTPDQSYPVSMGSTVTICHTINIHSPGVVALQLVSQEIWDYAVYDDANCDGVADGGPIVPSLGYYMLNGGNSLAEGTVCVVIRTMVPTQTPNGTVEKLTVTACEDWKNTDGVNGETGIVYDDMDDVVDTMLVNIAAGGVLHLEKWLRNVSLGQAFTKSNQLEPCQVLEYKIEFKNIGAARVKMIVISDNIPDQMEFLEDRYNTGTRDVVAVVHSATYYGKISDNPDVDGVNLNGGVLSVDLKEISDGTYEYLRGGEQGYITYQVWLPGSCP